MTISMPNCEYAVCDSKSRFAALSMQENHISSVKLGRNHFNTLFRMPRCESAIRRIALCHYHFKILQATNKTTSRRAHFVWSHIVCFSYETSAGRLNFEFVQTHPNYMTSMWLVCLISRAPLAGATPTYPERTTPTQLSAFQTSQVYWSRMPIVLGLRS